MAAFFYCVVIAFMVRLKPDLAPSTPIEPPRVRHNLTQVIIGSGILVGGIALYAAAGWRCLVWSEASCSASS